jgi:hypothetical protein
MDTHPQRDRQTLITAGVVLALPFLVWGLRDPRVAQYLLGLALAAAGLWLVAQLLGPRLKP